MSYDEFKEICRKSWEEDYNYLCIDRSKREIKEDIVFVMRAKTHIKNALLKRNLFDYIIDIFIKK